MDVNECYFGLVGKLTDTDPSDCTWRSYRPELPVFTMQYDTVGNVDGVFIPYTCKNWYTASWDEWPLSPETIE